MIWIEYKNGCNILLKIIWNILKIWPVFTRVWILLFKMIILNIWINWKCKSFELNFSTIFELLKFSTKIPKGKIVSNKRNIDIIKLLILIYTLIILKILTPYWVRPFWALGDSNFWNLEFNFSDFNENYAWKIMNFKDFLIFKEISSFRGLLVEILGIYYKFKKQT